MSKRDVVKALDMLIAIPILFVGAAMFVPFAFVTLAVYWFVDRASSGINFWFRRRSGGKRDPVSLPQV